MADLKRQMLGKKNKAAGAMFEQWISAACSFYLDKGIAYIEKTPEPFHITGKRPDGVITGYYEKKGQPDYKGILCDGTGIMLEAKHTDTGKIHQNVITNTQWENLNNYEKFGAQCFVLVSFGLKTFYRIPWAIWKQMKERYGHKHMDEKELKPFLLKERNCIILFLEGVELRNENAEKGIGKKDK